MNITILIGSPRKNGNTAALLRPFSRELKAAGCEVRSFHLYDLELRGCTACRHCQEAWDGFHCAIPDDCQMIFDAVMWSDLLILATPIYSWSCPAPMKAVLDRLVYGLNKFYGEKKGPALGTGKQAAILATCGYPPERGADLFEESIRRYCKHSSMIYRGMLAERHLGYHTVFFDGEKERRAREFARFLLSGQSAEGREMERVSTP